MQLTPQESSTAFWAGAKHGALRSFGYVALVGIPLLGLMAAGIIPTTLIGYGAALLTGLSTVFTTGMFSGQNALAQYHQQKHNQMYDAKLARLQGIAEQPELSPVQHLQHTPKITAILDQGARGGDSFAEAEEQRAAQSPKGPTIH